MIGEARAPDFCWRARRLNGKPRHHCIVPTVSGTIQKIETIWAELFEVRLTLTQG